MYRNNRAINQRGPRGSNYLDDLDTTFFHEKIQSFLNDYDYVKECGAKQECLCNINIFFIQIYLQMLANIKQIIIWK